jgi:ATP-binding cassette, subfamily F, member 3
VTLISLQSIGKLYGGRQILGDLDWQIEDEARVGLVGPNGSGKSTLLKIMQGSEDIQGGVIVKSRHLRLAMLPQHVPGEDRTPLEIVMSSREDLKRLNDQLRKCEESMATPEVAADPQKLERALATQERLLREIDALGGSGFRGEALAQLLRLGLEQDAVNRPTRQLSGGQRKLVALAACLTQRPNLLLLDEPETHLDLAHRETLEGVIREFAGGVVAVSHDRYLLDETVGEIAELEDGRLTLWSGNYSAYAFAKELALQRQQELYVAQQKEIERLEEAIKRFKEWAQIVVNERHIKQAHVKQRQIDMMDKVERPVLIRRQMGLRLDSERRGGQKVLELESATVGVGVKSVLQQVNLAIYRGERLGVIGENGSGKTLLARSLFGDLSLLSGRAWRGPSITFGYFAQGHETLRSDATLIDHVRQARSMYEDQAVSLLLKFLFRYDQVRQRVSSLSGGERSKLQLLLLMVGGANCLVLDEPTNHLDIDSLEVLEGAIEQFDGSVIVVSHDRYFLDRLVTSIVEVRGGSIRRFEGSYSDWNRQQTSKAAQLT